MQAIDLGDIASSHALFILCPLKSVTVVWLMDWCFHWKQW